MLVQCLEYPVMMMGALRMEKVHSSVETDQVGWKEKCCLHFQYIKCFCNNFDYFWSNVDLSLYHPPGVSEVTQHEIKIGVLKLMSDGKNSGFSKCFGPCWWCDWLKQPVHFMVPLLESPPVMVQYMFRCCLGRSQCINLSPSFSALFVSGTSCCTGRL